MMTNFWGKASHQTASYSEERFALGFPCSSVGRESACSAGDMGLIPGLGRSLGEGNGNPLQYPCLENLMDRGSWWAAVHGVTKSQARLSDSHLLTYALPLRDTLDLWIFYHNNGKHFLTLLLDISNHREEGTENASVGLLVCRVHLRRYVSRRELQGLLATETVNYSFCFQWGEFSQNIKYMVFFEMVETMRKRPNLIQPNWKLRLWRPQWYACD